MKRPRNKPSGSETTNQPLRKRNSVLTCPPDKTPSFTTPSLSDPQRGRRRSKATNAGCHASRNPARTPLPDPIRHPVDQPCDGDAAGQHPEHASQSMQPQARGLVGLGTVVPERVVLVQSGSLHDANRARHDRFSKSFTNLPVTSPVRHAGCCGASRAHRLAVDQVSLGIGRRSAPSRKASWAQSRSATPRRRHAPALR